MQTVVRGQHSLKLDSLRDTLRALQVMCLRFLLHYMRKVSANKEPSNYEAIYRAPRLHNLNCK